MSWFFRKKTREDFLPPKEEVAAYTIRPLFRDGTTIRPLFNASVESKVQVSTAAEAQEVEMLHKQSILKGSSPERS